MINENRKTQNLMPNGLGSISKNLRERFISNGAISINEREMTVNDLEIQKSKLLIRHLMKMYHKNNGQYFEVEDPEDNE